MPMATPEIAQKLAYGQTSIYEVMGEIKRNRKAIDHLLTEHLPVVGISHDAKATLKEYKHNLAVLEQYARVQGRLVDNYLACLKS